MGIVRLRIFDQTDQEITGDWGPTDTVRELADRGREGVSIYLEDGYCIVRVDILQHSIGVQGKRLNLVVIYRPIMQSLCWPFEIFRMNIPLLLTVHCPFAHSSPPI
jgi:hypothetical protein